MVAHLHFLPTQKPNKKMQKSYQANAPKTLQKMETEQRKTERQHLTAVWRNGGFSASYDSFVVGSSAVLRMNICAKNPPLRQAAKTLAGCASSFLT